MQDNLPHWSAWYRARGFVTLVVDIDGPRGVISTVHDEANPARFEREDDAGRALDYLIRPPFVDVNRVVLQGHSQGGWAVPKVYPGVHHSFDEPRRDLGPIKFMRYTIAYSASATEDSQRQIEQFLVRRLGRRPRH